MTERILNDRYALENKVGEGGMAVTYRARDLLLNRIVAVKLMREQFTSDPQFVERFRREAQAAARISHENIASVYDTGCANGTYYIVMEFVEGTDLKQHLRRDGALPVLNALEIGRQIAAALDAAHRGGLVHRDIKPHNILLNQDGKVKVTDFGIAKLASEGEDTGVIIGSVHYVSPEQARGEATAPASDIYSLGAVMFETLTGHTVFEADNAMAVAHKQIYDRPPLLRTLRPEIPPAVESMVLRCLEKDPRNRYQSAAELQAVIAQLINQLSQEATIVISPQAPSMDATMVFPTQRQAPSPPDPYRQPAAISAREEEPRRRGGSGWLIGIIVMVLAVTVAIWLYKLISPGGGGVTPQIPITGNVSVPLVVNLTKEAAIQELKKVKLKVEVTTEFNETSAEGEVFNQNPEVGTMVAEGTSVTITVSKGAKPQPFVMPDVSGQALDEAKNAIRLAGYGDKRDFTVRKKAASQPAGTVVGSDPAAGAQVALGKRIVLIVSTGPAAQSPIESWKGTFPNIGEVNPVYVRVEITRPGKQAEEMWSGSGAPGDAIPEQTFSRDPGEKVTVRMLAGKDVDSLTTQEEVPYPPGQSH